ncbi:syndetin-like isoform X2 [Mangifera indica]|uniref:syndetin-like isoform X2 n=1 Tax=Mangifera indica TaxID=29780 RepID=UPI001CFC151D|nr:syndetin-like isoform X2 [Mangifera indica]
MALLPSSSSRPEVPARAAATAVVAHVCAGLPNHQSLYLLNGRYVDLMLEEFKRYKTRLAHGGIRKEVQDHLLEYEVEIVAEILIEGLSRVKRCTDEGQAFLSLDLQVFINGLQHFVSINVKPKIQIVETFIKVTMSIVNCYKISKSRAKYEVKEVLLV